MRLPIFLWVIVFCSVLYQSPDTYAMEPQHTITLNNCTDELLGVEFLCHPEWNIHSDDNVLLIIISSQPYFTFTVSRSDEPVIFLSDLTAPVLQALGGYDNDFRVDEVEFAGGEALEVFAYAIDDPQTKMLDYYIIHNTRLYRFQFSVKPQESWPEAQNIVAALRNSIKFTR